MPFSNSTIDSTAHRISMGQTPEEIRAYLLELKLSDYNAYLCYKAASYLLSKGFYDR